MPVSRMHSDDEDERIIPELEEFDPLTPDQIKAREAIFEVFAQVMENNKEERERYDRDPRSYLRAVASTYGVTDEDFIDACGREAIMIILGQGWGVGPKSTWSSRLWWRIYLIKEKFKRV